MLSRIERLIRLSQRTGDTLIVHNEQGRDMVILDINQYEMLSDCGMYDECNYGIHDLSERELIDKINRDIAIWRTNQEKYEQKEHTDLLQDQLEKDPPFDPFEEDYAHATDWHRAGDILDSKKLSDRYRGYFEEDYEAFDSKRDNRNETYNKPNAIEHDDSFSLDDTDDELLYDTLGQDEIFSEKATKINEDRHHIPYMGHGQEELKETPLGDDEPVFFEEPV